MRLSELTRFQVSDGSSDPVTWFGKLQTQSKERLEKEVMKNAEFFKKVQSLEKERNDSVVKNAILEKSKLDANKKADECQKETKRAKASEEKMKTEAEKCRKTAQIATREHQTMKQQFTENSNVLKWTQNKLKSESEALGKKLIFHELAIISKIRFLS